MEIIHNLNRKDSNHSLSLNTIRGGKRASDVLQSEQKELLLQMTEAFSIVYGGHFKKRREIA